MYFNSFVLETRPEQRQLFDEKVIELASKAGLQSVEISKPNDESGSAGFPCFLQFVHAEEKSIEEGYKADNAGANVEANPETPLAGVNSVIADGIIEGESKDKNSEDDKSEVECSPKGDAN